MASPFKLVGFAAREEVLSSDLIRVQKLSSKALQDELKASSLDSNGNPINGFSVVPTINGVATTMTVTLGDGEAEVFSVTGVTADDSSYQVLAWSGLGAGSLVFATPDPTNPRIDLVVATPASVATDVQSRNILVDPVARTVDPANVAKTNYPQATIAVVTGTAAGSPVPPAIPGGSFALFEVLIPAAAADATAFVFIPRLFRRAAYPFTGGTGVPNTTGAAVFAPQTGIVRGCSLGYTGAFELLSSANNAVVIDGEVIDFTSTQAAFNDTLNNPYAGAAPGGNDVPYFIYVVGGRNLPSVNSASNPGQPVAIVMSLTAPNLDTGRPSSPIGAPRGSTSSACYVGIGFKAKGTTNHQKCSAVGDYVYFAATATADAGFEVINLAAAGVNQTLASAPSISNAAKLIFANVAGAGEIVGRLPGMNVANVLFARQWTAATGAGGDGPFDAPLAAGAGPHVSLVATATMDLRVVAYRMNVRRLG